MNLYNKLYKAINEGIIKTLNSLLIDDDRKITYNHSKIDNTLDIMDMLYKNFDELRDKESYLKIIDYYNNTGIRYKIDMEKFWGLYHTLTHTKGITKKMVSLDWIDMSNIVMAVTKSGQEYMIQNVNADDVDFLKFKLMIYYPSKLIFTIIIHKNLYIKQCQWCINQPSHFDPKDCKRYQDEQDFNGFENTYSNYNICQFENNDFTNYPAFKYISTLNNKENINNNYKAYLPAQNELVLIFNHNDFIAKCFNMIGVDIDKNFNLDKESFFWTSTEFDRNEAIDLKLTRSVPNRDYKDKELYVLPIFKQMN